MKDDPEQIAAWLVQEHGLEKARAEVMTGLLAAQEQGDNYALSVWREIKRILAAQADRESQSAA